MMNEEQVLEMTVELEQENTALKAEVAELQAKVKEQSTRLAAATKEKNKALAEATESVESEVIKLTGILGSQEDLITVQQQAIQELNDKLEESYKLHNDLAKKMQIIQVVMSE